MPGIGRLEQSPDSSGDFSCQISATVTSGTAGTYAETFQAGGYAPGGSSDGVSGTDPETLYVVAAPTTTASFAMSQVAVGQTDTLTFDVTNPAVNGTGLTGVGFSSALPSGLTVASSSSTVCGGTLTTTSPHSISLTGASIDAHSDCLAQVHVTGTTVGDWDVTTSVVSSTEGGTGAAASTSVTVVSFARLRSRPRSAVAPFRLATPPR